MTLRLTIDGDAWWRHVERIADAVPGLVPVVKGNGYGFGRAELAAIAARLADTIAVGTVYELDELPADVTPVVLTPTLIDPGHARAVLTIGSPAHIEALQGTRRRVIVKLTSSMRRYGRGPELVAAARAAGLTIVGCAIHPPLAGDTADHRHEIERWLPAIEPEIEVWVSHVSPDTLAELPTTHRYRLRLGTALWHGDKSALHLDALAVDVRSVAAGDRVGYRLVEVPSDGHLVMIGAGSAHGVAPLADGRSPFHFARRRMALVEPPHMHTSMAFVPADEPCPAVGAWIDVQRPLITTMADVVRWT